MFWGNNGADGEIITVPPKSNRAWQIFKYVAETTDENGEV